MPDITFKAEMIEAGAFTLEQVSVLSPPPTPKGRYALSKALDAAIPARDRYRKEKLKELTLHAKKDEKDKPVTQTVGEVTTFDFGDGFGVTPEHVAAAIAALNDEDVVLSGCRMITHAELGACPITPAQERVLIKMGLLEDKEPE